jgi:putative cell wall-binding protein
VSGNVETQLSGAAVKRYGGSDRYGTSLEIINGLFGGKAAALAVSTGSSYPDSLVSAALSGKSNGAILLVDGKGTALTESQKTVLKNAGSVWILGGDNAVSAVMKTSIDSALR